MRRSSATVRVAVALAVTASALAACGEGAAAPPERRTLTIAMAEDWASAPTFRAVVDRFEAEHDGLRVQVTDAPFSQIPAVVRNASDLGQPYDLAHWHAFGAGAAGIAEDLGDLWDEAGLEPEAYIPGAVESVTWDGVRYGVPLDVNALVLLADGAALEAGEVTPADLTDPTAFAATADRLVDGGAPFAVTVSSSSWVAHGWVRAFGGDLVALDDGEATFGFDDPRTVAALDTLQQLVADERSPAPYAPDLAADAVTELTSGQVALHTSGSWDLPVTRRALDPAIDVDDIEVLPMPSVGPGSGTALGGSSLFVPVGGDRELAFEFMLALTEPDVGLELVETEGRLPAVRAPYGAPPFTEDAGYRTFAAELDRADVMWLLAYPQVEAAFGEALESILRLERPAADALADVQEFAETTAATSAAGATPAASSGGG